MPRNAAAAAAAASPSSAASCTVAVLILALDPQRSRLHRAADQLIPCSAAGLHALVSVAACLQRLCSRRLHDRSGPQVQLHSHIA